MGLKRGKSRGGKLVAVVDIAFFDFVRWHRIRTSEESEPVDVRDLIDRWEIEDALTRALQVLRGLRVSAEAEYSIPT